MAQKHYSDMPDVALKDWRKSERARLIAARVALDASHMSRLRVAMDAHLERAFPMLATGTVAFCWPYRNEYDARHLMHRMRARGARTALPVVIGSKQPLIFRYWKPGDVLAKGVYDIPYPPNGEAIVPDMALVPMNGFDTGGYRLGYGGGFFDRTLASLRAGGLTRPLAIGVTYELARMETIHPQPYDIPMDYVVTERGVYERRASGLRLTETGAT